MVQDPPQFTPIASAYGERSENGRKGRRQEMPAQWLPARSLGGHLTYDNTKEPLPRDNP